MKKLLFLMLIGMLVLFCTPIAFAVYDGEILFRGIPWDTDIVSFKDQIISEIQPREKYSRNDSIIYSSALFYFDENEMDMLLYEFSDEENRAYRVVIHANDDVFVAGWPLAGIDAQGIPKIVNGKVSHDPSNSRIVRCVYHFLQEATPNINLAKQNIKDKLVGIYGDVDFTVEYEDSFKYVWYGANNTYINLWGESSIALEYGITNTLDLVYEIDNPEFTVDLSSTSGL